MMFTAIASPDMIRFHRRLGSLGLLLLLGMASMVSTRPAARFPERRTAADAAAQAHILDEVEPLYRALFPKKDVLHFTLASGILHPHKAGEKRGWIVDCYDNAGREIAHGLWDEQGRRHITISVPQRRPAASTLSFLSPEAAAQAAKDWLYRTGMAVPQGKKDSVYAVNRSDEVWHVTVRLSDGVLMVWMNARSGEVHQATRSDSAPVSAVSGIASCAPSQQP